MRQNKLEYNKKSSLNSKMAFILGLVTCQNVVYVFKVNNTYINIFQLITFFVFMYNLIIHRKKLEKALGLVDKTLGIFFGWCFFSIILFIITIIRIPTVKSSSYFVGLITYSLAFMYYVCVLIYRDDIDSFIKGITTGFIINVVVCLLEYICFERGAYFSLYKIFPQSYYYVSIPWENRGLLAQNEDLIYSYRASGLFLEASHFISYLSVIGLIVYTTNKNKKLMYTAFFIISILALISGSGTFVAYLAVLILFALVVLVKTKNFNKIKFRNLLIIGIFLIGICLVFYSRFLTNMDIFHGSTINEFLNTALMTSNLLDAENITRWKFMQNAFKAIFQFPFGIGCNMAPTVLSQLYGTYSTFSFILSIILELGPIGIILYISFFVKNIKKVLINSSNTYDIAIGIAMIATLAVQLANGIGLSCYIIALFALVRIRILEKGKNNT